MKEASAFRKNNAVTWQIFFFSMYVEIIIVVQMALLDFLVYPEFNENMTIK